MKKLSEIKVYPLLAILGLAVVLFVIRLPMFKTTPKAPHMRGGSMVQLNVDAFKEALVDDSCEFSKNKLTCSPVIMRSILQGVDSVDLEAITENSITFKKAQSKGFVEIPASVLTNMIDVNLFKKPNKEQCDEQ